MPRTWLIAASILAAAIAPPAGARISLFSVTVPVIAVVADDLFTGVAHGYWDRTGSIEIRSTSRPTVRCSGKFRYTAGDQGEGSVACNDGREAAFRFQGLSRRSGYGLGQSANKAFSFTFGLTPEESVRYLKLPPDTTLHREGEKLRLLRARGVRSAP